MKLAQLHPALQEALAVHEAYRRLGFAAEDIYISQQNGNLFCILKTQGKDFVICVGALAECELEELTELWGAATYLWNEVAPEAERQALWENSCILHDATGFVMALTEKGILIPNSFPAVSSLLN